MVIQWILFATFISIFIATAIITLLGVTEKIHVKPEFLKPLFAALIIELIGVVISQYDSTILAANDDAIFISSLPTQHQSASVENSLKSISNTLLKIEKLNNQIETFEININTCKAELKTSEEKLNTCTIPNSGILANLLRLQDDIKEHGPTINFLWQPNKKKDAAFRVMNILGELGFSQKEPKHDPVEASESLELYQISKGIEPASGKLGRKTFIQLLNDYIIIETNGG